MIEPIAEQERLITDIISDHTIVSQFHEDRIMPPITTNAFQEPVEEKEPGKKILIREKPASFPGGESAWLNFLQRYLHTPGDLEEGQRIEVRVQFWIEADGSLSRFEIVKSGGTSFDKEVLRVMTKMPKWIPAIQNDHNVPVSFTQPVIFLSVEE